MSENGLSKTDIPTLGACLTSNDKARASGIFSLENIDFAYDTAPGKRNVLKNIDFTLFPGQSIGLCGANGSGKTTFFRCVTGLEKPLKGNIYFNGRIVGGEKDFHALRQQVGLVLQDSTDQLFMPTVLEDVAFGPLNQGLSQTSARERAIETLELMGCAALAPRLTGELSGGESKLAALAGILAMRPRALLLDEPLNGLDPEATTRVIKIIRDFPNAKIIIAHDPQFLRGVTSGIMRLEHGRLALVEN